MATSIQTNFDSIYLTSNLPEEISFATDKNSLKVTLFINYNEVFSSDYYPYQGVVTIRDIRSIVETTMIDNLLSLASLSIVATEPTESSSNITYDENGNIHMTYGNDEQSPESVLINDISVIYCIFKVNVDSETFLNNNFLSTRKSALVPRSKKLILNYYRKQNVKKNIGALIFYRNLNNPEKILNENCSLGDTGFPKVSGITYEILTYEYFKNIIDQKKGISSEILGVVYQIGEKLFSIFYTSEEPTESFTFLNAFNVEESAYLYNTSTIKIEVDRNEAVCGQQTQFYDETINTKHEVETCAMPYSEAKWLNQMLTSKRVTHPIDEDNLAQVLISDITSEITDSDKDLIHLKFSWKYADGAEWI